MNNRFHIFRRFIAPIPLILLLLTGLGSCKPTEKNYRSAYDVARQKTLREEEERRLLQADLQIAGDDRLQEVDGVRLEPIADTQAWILHLRFPKDTEQKEYSLTPARFRMPTNANAMAEQFPGARVVKAADQYYVIVAETNSDSIAVAALKSFKIAHPDLSPIGLPDIVIIRK